MLDGLRNLKTASASAAVIFSFFSNISMSSGQNNY